MDLPLFALHSVVYPGGRIALHVFEERYLRMMDDVLPEAPFAIAAIRLGQEVGGTYEPYPVGVQVQAEDFELREDGTLDIEVVASARIRLLEQVAAHPYARWRTEPFPEGGRAEPSAAAAALAAAARFLEVAGVEGELEVDRDPVAMSYALAVLTPGLVPERQVLLELSGPGERLTLLARIFRRETALLQALRERRGS